MSVLDLARPDIRALRPYSSARMEANGGTVLLNANESAWAPFGDGNTGCNRYPERQPQALIDRLAELSGVESRQVLAGRGSSEAIDLLLRAFCRAERDAVLIQPPTFALYEVCARIQGAQVIAAPLDDDLNFDADAVRAAITPAVKLVFVCTPNNPNGSVVSRAEIKTLLRYLNGRALLVVDEAYVEFSDAGSVADLIDRNDNLVILRTLSKAWGLAGARVGALLASAEIVALLSKIMPPYPLPSACTMAVLDALSPVGLAVMRQRVAVVRKERTRMLDALRNIVQVRAVLPSQANFLAVRFNDAAAIYQRLLDAGIVVRELRGWSKLADALRITIGTPQENDSVLAALTEVMT